MKIPKPRRPITPLESEYLKHLNGCTFLPGSPVKRFVRTMQGAAELTDKQAEFLRATVYHYRRQLGLSDKEASSLVDEMANPTSGYFQDAKDPWNVELIRDLFLKDKRSG